MHTTQALCGRLFLYVARAQLCVHNHISYKIIQIPSVWLGPDMSILQSSQTHLNQYVACSLFRSSVASDAQICVFPSAWNIRGFWVLKPLYSKYENLVSYYAAVQVLSSLMKWIYNCNYLVHYSHRDSNFPLPKHWIWLIPVRWRAWRAGTAKNTVIFIISVKSVEETSQAGKRGSEMTWCWLWV